MATSAMGAAEAQTGNRGTAEISRGKTAKTGKTGKQGMPLPLNKPVPAHVKCFNCGGNHYVSKCPTVPPEKRDWTFAQWLDASN